MEFRHAKRSRFELSRVARVLRGALRRVLRRQLNHPLRFFRLRRRRRRDHGFAHRASLALHLARLAIRLRARARRIVRRLRSAAALFTPTFCKTPRSSPSASLIPGSVCPRLGALPRRGFPSLSNISSNASSSPSSSSPSPASPPFAFLLAAAFVAPSTSRNASPACASTRSSASRSFTAQFPASVAPSPRRAPVRRPRRRRRVARRASLDFASLDASASASATSRSVARDAVDLPRRPHRVVASRCVDARFVRPLRRRMRDDRRVGTARRGSRERGDDRTRRPNAERRSRCAWRGVAWCARCARSSRS